MPSDKSGLEKKSVLINKAKQLLDLLYSEADAKADEAIQRFREDVLQRLNQLSHASYADEINLLTDFINQLKTVLVEFSGQTIPLKENKSTENYYIFNINSQNIVHENGQQHFGETKIIVVPTNNYHIYPPNQEESKIAQQAAGELQKDDLKPLQHTAELETQATKFNSLYERFAYFYAAQRVKRTFGESEEGEIFDDLYTRLALIREREVKEDRERSRRELNSLKQISADRMARDEHLHLFEHILYTERKPIEEDQLFLPVADDAVTLHQKGRIDRILIRGQAGVGKTTFCYHLARKLIEQHHWVFVIPLRYLQDVAEKLTDVDVIRRALRIELTQEEITLLAQLLADKTKTAYWLLDGYDEIVALPVTHPLQQWITKAFQKERVIVTTRPREVKEFATERQIEMIGYLPDDVEKYVMRYFTKQHEKRESFMAFVKEQKQLGAIHRIPIILELMCWVWDDLTTREGVNTTELSFTDLYVNVLQGLNRRYLMKDPKYSSLVRDGTDEEIEKQLGTYLDPLVELAYQTFTANQLIFTGREITRCLQVSSDVRRMILYEFGLVRCLRDAGSFDRNEFSFIHLTGQEFLMAKRWAQLFTSKDHNEIARAVNLFTGRKVNDEWVDCHKYDKRFEVVWGFVAGLLKDKPEDLHRFLDLIAGAPRDQIGGRHINLLLQVVGEANCLKEDSREYEEIAVWFNSYGGINLEDCALILARYPVVVSVLQREWDKLWAGEEWDRNRSLVITLLSRLRLDQKDRIYSDLVRALETDTEIEYDFSAARALGQILLTEAQQEKLHPLLFNRLQHGNEDNAQDIIYALENIYSRRQFSQEFPSNLFDSLFACIAQRDDSTLVVAAIVLGKMDLSEEERLSILNTLLLLLSGTFLHQAQIRSFNDTQCHLIEALGYISIPEEQQAEMIRFLMVIANNTPNSRTKGKVLETLSRMNLPESLRKQMVTAFLNHLGSNDSDAIAEGLRRIFIVLSEQDQAQVMTTLLTHLKGNHREKKRASFSVLRDMKIPKNYQASVLDALWNGLHDSDEIVKANAIEVLVGMDIPEETQLQFIDALLDDLNKTSILTTEAIIKTLGAIPIPERLKPKVMDALFDRLSQEDRYANSIITSLGCIGIPQKLSKKIVEITYARGTKEFYELHPYCLILDDDLPYYLREVMHIFVYHSADAATVHIAGPFNNWLNAINGEIDSLQHDSWYWAMKERRDVWILPVRWLPGSYEFNYVIDHGRRWETDPNYPLSVNGHSVLKIEPGIRRTTAYSIDSHTEILSRLRSNSNNTLPMTASSLPSKHAVDNEIALSDAEEPEVTDATKPNEEEDTTTNKTHTMGR